MSASIYRVTGAALMVAVFGLAHAAETTATLTGAQEVPAVISDAKGTAAFTVGADNSVGGKVTTTGIVGTAAHIHSGAVGENGPVVIPLQPGPGGEWLVPAGSKLTDQQLAAYKAGTLYVNVHSDAHKGGRSARSSSPSRGTASLRAHRGRWRRFR